MPTTSRPPSPKGGGDRGGGGAPRPCAPPGSSSGPGIRACSAVSGSAACTWASSGFPSGWAILCATASKVTRTPDRASRQRRIPSRTHASTRRRTGLPEGRPRRSAGRRSPCVQGGTRRRAGSPSFPAMPRAGGGQPPATTRGGRETAARQDTESFFPPRRKPHLPCSLRAFPPRSATQVPTAN